MIMAQVIACHLFGAKPFPEQMMIIYQLGLQEPNSLKFQSKHSIFQWNEFENVDCEMTANLSYSGFEVLTLNMRGPS